MSGNKHLVIASGGTGGHFYPTLAVARSFVAAGEGNRVTLLVSGMHAAEQAEIAAKYGFAAREVPSVRMPSGVASALQFPFKLWKCRARAKKVLAELKPDVVLGMGSFAAVPACLAVNTKTTPLVLHEGNSFMGKTNRLFIRKASAIGLSLPLADTAQTQGTRSQEVGMPLRDAIVTAAAGDNSVPAGFLAGLGLQEGRKTVLVFGGSQGARAVNELIVQAAAKLGEVRDLLQFIHLTGTDDNAPFIEAYAKAGVAASVRRADGNIEKCYLAADLVICRSGASSICELALFGKPVVLIPLPTAADDHQTVNARVLEAAGAARLFPQREATPAKLADLLRDWLTKPQEWQERGQRLRAFGKPKAADDMVKLILSVLDKN